MPSEIMIDVQQLSHHYGERCALDQVSLAINSGEFFAILGPNGGGKSTLFRVLATLVKPQAGRVLINDLELVEHAASIRTMIGVVFQSPSLDKKLSVDENLWCQGRLYGLTNSIIQKRTKLLLTKLGIIDRQHDRVETLSGGLKRRVEICKALLHEPRLLLLDEPTTGLDPLVRYELWEYLRQLRMEVGITVVMTTHFLDEADKADRIAILDAGHVVALDQPDRLRSALAGEALTIECANPQQLVTELQARFQLPAQVLDDRVRIEVPQAHQWIVRLVEGWPQAIGSITLGKPSLEDVFIAKTGKRFQ
jgi:ABC-2 type transport system ATP-binding protein